MNKAIIGLGSNIEPEKNIKQAREILAKRFVSIAESKFITTEPIGYKEQDNFINGSVFIETDLDFEELTTALKDIETELGRTQSSIKFGPRTIDLDIVVWNDKVVDQDFYERDFLKNSVLELLPDLKY